MDTLNEKNKKLIKLGIAVALFILIIATITILILRYNTEGEKNLPFKITSIRVISTAQGNSQGNSPTELNLDIIQKNDFYFYLEKNPNYTKEDSISKITFENFNIETPPQIGNVSIYKPSVNTLLYTYTDENKIENSLSFNGSLSTNITSLEIGNQGGLIGFSIALNNLGSYTVNDTEITHDGTLLSKLNLNNEDICMTISFDIIIETTSNKKFKATLSFDLPTGNIIENGISVLDKTDLDDIVFKRF